MGLGIAGEGIDDEGRELLPSLAVCLRCFRECDGLLVDVGSR